MLKLFSQLAIGHQFCDMFEGNGMWQKVDATTAKCIDPDDVAHRLGEESQFSALCICSVDAHSPSKMSQGGYTSIGEDLDAKKVQSEAAAGLQIPVDSPFVDMALACREDRLFAFDPYVPNRDYGFVVSTHPINKQHDDATVWVVDALGRKEPLNGVTPVIVWQEEFSDPYFVPEADALIKALYVDETLSYQSVASKVPVKGYFCSPQVEKSVAPSIAVKDDDETILGYLKGLKSVFKDPRMHKTLDVLAASVKASPVVAALVKAEFEQEIKTSNDAPSP